MYENKENLQDKIKFNILRACKNNKIRVAPELDCPISNMPDLSDVLC